jgi:hypothetical protein
MSLKTDSSIAFYTFLEEWSCIMELREPHSKPTHNQSMRTNPEHKNGMNKKEKRNQRKDIVFKRTAASKQ